MTRSPASRPTTEPDRVARPVPVQVSWDEASERARRGVDEFHAAHPTAGDGVFVTAASFMAGFPELPAPTGT